jgi:hypothetical protein
MKIFQFLTKVLQLLFCEFSSIESLSAAGIPTGYAAAAGPTTATVSSGPQPAEARIQ